MSHTPNTPEQFLKNYSTGRMLGEGAGPAITPVGFLESVPVDFGNAFEKGFLKESWIGSAAALLTGNDFDTRLKGALQDRRTNFPIDEDYDYLRDPEILRFPRHMLKYFSLARSENERKLIGRMLRIEIKKADYIQATGIASSIGMLLGWTSNDILVAGAPFLKGMAAIIGTQSIAELLHNPNQPVRTAEEALMNIGGQAAFTGAAWGIYKMYRSIPAIPGARMAESLAKQMDEAHTSFETGQKPFDPLRDPDPWTGRQAPMVERAIEDFNNSADPKNMHNEAAKIRKEFGDEAAEIYLEAFKARFANQGKSVKSIVNEYEKLENVENVQPKWLQKKIDSIEESRKKTSISIQEAAFDIRLEAALDAKAKALGVERKVGVNATIEYLRGRLSILTERQVGLNLSPKKKHAILRESQERIAALKPLKGKALAKHNSQMDNIDTLGKSVEVGEKRRAFKIAILEQESANLKFRDITLTEDEWFDLAFTQTSAMESMKPLEGAVLRDFTKRMKALPDGVEMTPELLIDIEQMSVNLSRGKVTFPDIFSVDEIAKINTRAGMEEAINRNLELGNLSKAQADDMLAVVNIMPENFFLQMQFGAAISHELPRWESGTSGMYYFFQDVISIWGGTISRVGGSAGEALAHEISHRVMFTMADEADLVLGRKIFDRFRISKSTAESLEGYPNSKDHFIEWWAFEYADYWTRRVKEGKPAALTFMENAYRKDALDLANLFERMAINLMSFIRTMRGVMKKPLTEAEMVNAFFDQITQKIDKKHAKDVSDNLEATGFIRATQFDKGDNFLSGGQGIPSGPVPNADSYIPNMFAGAYAKVSRNMPYEEKFDPSATSDSLMPAWGLEKLPDSPGKGILNSSSAFARHVLSYLVEHPWYQNKNVVGGVTPHGVDRNISVEWIAYMSKAEEQTDAIYARYRTRYFNEAGDPNIAQGREGIVAQKFEDVTKGRGGALTHDEFLVEVGRAKIRMNRTDMAGADILPEAMEAAIVWDELIFKRAGKQAQEFQVFSIKERRRLADVQETMDKLLADTATRGMTVKQIKFADNLEQQIDELNAAIKEADTFDLDPNYIPHLWNVPAIQKDFDTIKVILMRELGYNEREATAKLQMIIEGKAFIPIDDELTGIARSLKERQIPIDSIHVEDFIELNMTYVGKYYATRVGADIELTKQFGSIDLLEITKRIREDFQGKISRADPGLAGRQKKVLARRAEAETKLMRGTLEENSILYKQALDSLLEEQARVDILSINGVVVKAKELPTQKFVKEAINFAKFFETGPHKFSGDDLILAFGKMEEKLTRITGQIIDDSSISIETGDLFAEMVENIRATRINIDAAANFLTDAKLNPKALKLLKESDTVIEDLLVIRDRIRGTYGIPDDPTTWTHRGIRLAKMWNMVSLLTGALAAVPDLAKVVVADGLTRTVGTILESYKSQLGAIGTMKLAKVEARIAGEAWDMYTGMRAALLADLGDGLSSTTKFERQMGRGTQMFFNFALMNQWNEAVKTLASLVTGSRIIVESQNLVSGKIGKTELTKLSNVGIDVATARIIVDQTNKHGLVGDYVRIAKTELWDKTPEVQAAAGLYTRALGKDINRIIVTPGKGEIPAFMSQDLWSLIFMFKSFSIAATHRTLIPGLQLKDKNFLVGIIGLIGLGAMVEAIRRYQLDDNREQEFGDWLISAIERSGLLGIFSDLNSSLETLSDNGIGLRPLLGAADPYGSSNLAKGSAIGGPIVQQMGNLGRVIWDIGPGEADDRTADSLRRLMWAAKVAHTNALLGFVQSGLEEVIGE